MVNLLHKMRTNYILLAAFALIVSGHGYDQIVPFNQRPRTIQGRIINGQQAVEKQFPWYALLKPTFEGADTYCGGSILSKNWVLTAAHCAYKFDFIELYFGSIDSENMPLKMVSKSWIVHPNYNEDNLNNDIAVVSLPVPLTFTNTIQPVQLLSLTQAKTDFLSQEGQVAGFGYTSDVDLENPRYLMFTVVKVIANSECFNYYGDLVIDSTMCAKGYPQIFQSTCHGDSGGPLLMKDGNTFTQIGVTSFVSDEGCGSGKPSGYARLGKFLSWINEKTGVQLRP